jgi:hypothetical protein
VRRLGIVALAYLAAYFAAGWLDLYSTELALRSASAQEGNVLATDEKGYSSALAWKITLFAAPLIAGALVFGLANARHVARRRLEHPVRFFGNPLYLAFWREQVLDRSPLHLAAFAIAFPVLRIIAAANNLLIYCCDTAPLGWLIGRVARHSSLPLGFWLVMGPLFCLLALAFAPVAARLLRRFRD